jgi:hypothetical protein
VIRNVSNCPYCGSLSAGVDDETPELVLAPDRADGRPCEHLAFLIVSLNAYRRRGGREEPRRTGHWLWVRGNGVTAVPDEPFDPLSDYVDMLACGMYAGDSLPVTVYLVAGAAAGTRERERPGSGEFPLSSRCGPALAAYLDAFGIYSPAPDTLVAEVRYLAARLAPAEFPEPKPGL